MAYDILRGRTVERDWSCGSSDSGKPRSGWAKILIGGIIVSTVGIAALFVVDKKREKPLHPDIRRRLSVRSSSRGSLHRVF